MEIQAWAANGQSVFTHYIFIDTAGHAVTTLYSTAQWNKLFLTKLPGVSIVFSMILNV